MEKEEKKFIKLHLENNCYVLVLFNIMFRSLLIEIKTIKCKLSVGTVSCSCDAINDHFYSSAIYGFGPLPFALIRYIYIDR